MSTPSGKASHSVTPSDDQERSAYRRTGTGWEAAESTKEPPLSAYAPKRARQSGDTPPPSGVNDPAFLQVIVDWKRAKEAAELEPRPAAAPAEVTGEKQRDSRGGEQQVLDAVQQAVEAARKAINDSPLHVTEGGGKSVDEADLENLVARLRRVQRQRTTAMRFPPAPKLPPVAGLVPSDSPDTGEAHIGERTADPLQVSLRSLEPTRLAPPPMEHRRHSNVMLGVSIGCTLIAGIVYYLLEAGAPSSPQPISQPQIGHVVSEPAFTALDTNPSPRPEQLASALNDNHETRTEATIPAPPAVTPVAMAPNQPETLPIAPPIPVAAPAAASGAPVPHPSRTLDPEAIALLIKEAEKHMASGDVVTARMIFQRAAEAGDATAALALAATYDPTALARLGVMGMGADVEKARAWYRMAESFGSAEAKQRFGLLTGNSVTKFK